MGVRIVSLELKSLKNEAVALLDADKWTLDKLATATVKEIMAYKGIGRVGAAKAIAEAADLLNEQGLDDSDRLALEQYYEKAPPAKILKDWEAGGLSVKAVALSSAAALSALKSTGLLLALRLISEAQDVVNKRGLYQSRVRVPGGLARQTNAAFDERWLSGAIEPPAMSIRVRRNFERAQREYKEQNG
jgi:hypothetical protein